MPVASLNETSIVVGTSVLQDRINAIRASITNTGFPNNNYDTWTSGSNTYWVIEQVWNPSNARGKIYLQFRYQVVSAAEERLHLTAFDSWSIAMHTGTNGTQEITLDLAYNPNSTYDLKITAIAHTELRGFIWQQEDRFGALFFARPANIYRDQFDDINYAWFFLINNNFDTAYQPVNFNPFRDAGSYTVESWQSLKDKLPTATAHQLLKGIKIVAPDNCGFLGAFSSDIALVNSNDMAWKTLIIEDDKEYTLIRAKSSSGIAIIVKDGTSSSGGDGGGNSSGDGGGISVLSIGQYTEAYAIPHHGYNYGRGTVSYGFVGQTSTTEPYRQKTDPYEGITYTTNNETRLITASKNFDFIADYAITVEPRYDGIVPSDKIEANLKLDLIIPRIFSWADPVYPDDAVLSQKLNLNIEVTTTGNLQYQGFNSPNALIVAVNDPNTNQSTQTITVPATNSSTVLFSQVFEKEYNRYIDFIAVNANGVRTDDGNGDYYLLTFRGYEVNAMIRAEIQSSATATIRVYGSFEATNVTNPSNLIFSVGTPIP